MIQSTCSAEFPSPTTIWLIRLSKLVKMIPCEPEVHARMSTWYDHDSCYRRLISTELWSHANMEDFGGSITWVRRPYIMNRRASNLPLRLLRLSLLHPIGIVLRHPHFYSDLWCQSHLPLLLLRPHDTCHHTTPTGSHGTSMCNTNCSSSWAKPSMDLPAPHIMSLPEMISSPTPPTSTILRDDGLGCPYVRNSPKWRISSASQVPRKTFLFWDVFGTVELI